MKNVFLTFRPSLDQITKNKINLILAIIPIILGGFLYYKFGSWFYSTIMDYGQNLINDYVSQGTMGSIVYYILATLVTVLLFLLVNWTFVLSVSVIASPFNDMLSSRIEKQLQGKELEGVSDTFKQLILKSIKTILNEVKKISFILTLSIIAFVLGYFPILAPISILINVILLSVSFIDYSWSRNDISFKECRKDIRKNILGYSISGGFFFVLVSIPLVNLVVPPLATSFYTVLWVKNNERSS
ncbi:MAG: EI24 domain-containing protein [Bacteriovoracaceae bacterium]|jgi:CysZ protein|nr:EI24 domain-containing protein [Bacteriovoracaceae bacterium]